MKSQDCLWEDPKTKGKLKKKRNLEQQEGRTKQVKIQVHSISYRYCHKSYNHT